MLPVRTCFLALGLLALLVGAHGRFLLQGKDDGDVSKDKNEDKAVIEVEAEENVTMLSGEGDENATAFANGAGMNLTALEGKNMTVPAEDGKNATALGDKAEKNMTVIEGEKGGNVTTEGLKADANVTNLGMDQEESMTSVEKKEKRDKKVPKEADKKMTALQMEESDNVTVVLVLPEETDGDAESLPERKNETMTAEVAEEDGEKQKRNVTIVLVPKMEEKNDNTKKLGEKVAEPSMDEDGKSANGSAVPMDEDIAMTSTVVEEGKNATVQDSDDVQYEDGEQDAAVILPAPGDKVEDTEDVAEEEDKATVVQEDEDKEEQLLVQNGGKNAKNGPIDEENNMSALQKDDGKKELTAGEEKNTTSVPAEKESMATAILPEEEDNGATVGAENGDNVTDSVLVLGENLTMVVVNSKENATSVSEAEEKLVPTRSFKDEDTFRKEKEEKKVADTTRGGDSKVATVEKEANGMANVVSEDEDEEKDRTDASNGDGVEDIEAVEEDGAPEAGTNEKGNSTNLATEEQEDPTQEEDATTGLAKVQVFNMLEESTTVEISFRIGRLTYGGTLELSPGLRELVEILPETEDIVLEFPDCGSAVRTYKDTSELVGPEGIISIIIDEDCVDSLR